MHVILTQVALRSSGYGCINKDCETVISNACALGVLSSPSL